MTNLDKIRQMSADELAELLDSGSCAFCSFRVGSCTLDQCVPGIKKWLESEADE